MRQLPLRWAIAATFAFASASANPQAAYPSKLTDVSQAAAGQSLVIGSIKFFKAGKQKSCGAFLVSQCRLIVLPPAGRHAMIYPFTGNLGFSWSLPPGDYTLLGIEYVENGIALLPVRARFTIPASATAAYIGDVALITSKNASDVGLARAAAEYRNKFPDRPPPADATMQTEADPGTAKEMRYICAEGWGITCTKRYHGVTPLRPAEVANFEPVDGLNPLFKWQPSSDPAVSYDMAVYEAADYKGYQRTTYIPGRLVAYRQALTPPAWQVDRPLLPGQRYFWSVRLRKSETISNWSTYAYFNFFLTGFSSGSGQWFSFSTPQQ